MGPLLRGRPDNINQSSQFIKEMKKAKISVEKGQFPLPPRRASCRGQGAWWW